MEVVVRTDVCELLFVADEHRILSEVSAEKLYGGFELSALTRPVWDPENGRVLLFERRRYASAEHHDPSTGVQFRIWNYSTDGGDVREYRAAVRSLFDVKGARFLPRR